MIDVDDRTQHPPDAPIFLVGFMATGKTTVGKLLAEGDKREMLDLDELIVAEAGMSVASIFAAEGEAGFRAREARALRAAAARRHVVIATGGGAACNHDNMSVMLAAGTVIALEVSPAEALRRAGTASGRPLLEGHADPLAAAEALLAARRPHYARATFSVATDGLSPEDVVREIRAHFAARAARAAVGVARGKLS